MWPKKKIIVSSLQDVPSAYFKTRLPALHHVQEKMTLMQAPVWTAGHASGAARGLQLSTDSDLTATAGSLSGALSCYHKWQHCFLCYSGFFLPSHLKWKECPCRRIFFLDTDFKMYHWDVMLTWAVIMGFVFIFLSFSSPCCSGIIPTMYRSL